jgi:hypothetical protein
MDIFNREDCLIVARFAMSEKESWCKPTCRVEQIQ